MIRRFLYLKKTIEGKMKRQEEEVHVSDDEVQDVTAQQSDDEESKEDAKDAEETEEEKPKRRPGASKKISFADASNEAKPKGQATEPELKIKRGPGRPPKSPSLTNRMQSQVVLVDHQKKKKKNQIRAKQRRPGRPPKSVVRRPRKHLLKTFKIPSQITRFKHRIG